eukprot:m.316448 g.316448  ORF g.316448 m.316448 type:complete len:253 (-) comp55462_c0_seq11:1766-2524(-)
MPLVGLVSRGDPSSFSIPFSPISSSSFPFLFIFPGTLILIVCPWDSPIPITRAWCLWEIMSAITQSNVKFRVRMPRSIINEFVAGFLSDPDRVMAALSSVQAEKADAKEPRDLEMIFEAIRSSCGFLEMNKRINDQLRTWYLQTAVVAAKDITAAQASDGEQLAQVSACVGFILADFGEYEKALLHFNTCLSIRQASAEADPVDIATLYNNIGLMHKRMDDLDQVASELALPPCQAFMTSAVRLCFISLFHL